MLISIPGVVRNGVIELKGATLPEGAEVVVVAHETITATSETRQKAFDEFEQLAAETPAESDIDSLSDEELVKLVHETRIHKTS